MGKRILVIDDDKDILAVLAIILDEEGYEAILYQTVTTTDQIKLLHPDLILLDVRIAGSAKTGAQICAEIRTETELNDIPVVLVSAETNLGLLASTCGANGYVSKPFNIDDILAKVKELIIL